MQDGKYVISQKLMGDWEKTKKSISKAIMDNPNKVASILADNSDEDYDFTFDPKEAGGLNILIETDPNGIMVAKPTPEQRAAAEEKLKVAIESRVSEEEKEVDKTKEWALSLKQQDLNLQIRKQKFEEDKVAIPIQTRVNTIARMLETGELARLLVLNCRELTKEERYQKREKRWILRMPDTPHLALSLAAMDTMLYCQPREISK
jgi:hypothetical protein